MVTGGRPAHPSAGSRLALGASLEGIGGARRGGLCPAPLRTSLRRLRLRLAAHAAGDAGVVAKKVINYRFSATPQQVTGRTRAHDVRCTIRPSLLERDSHGIGCYHHFMTTAPNLNWIANYIWGIADDVLRDVYVRGKYRDVILPMTVLRRLDAVLEPTKQAVLDMKASLDAAGSPTRTPRSGRRPAKPSTTPRSSP